MASPFIPAKGDNNEEKSARALEYIAARMGSIDDTLLKLLKAYEAAQRKK
jgi:hypothetical protein